MKQYDETLHVQFHLALFIYQLRCLKAEDRHRCAPKHLTHLKILGSPSDN